MLPLNRVVVFQHLHKTGGTTVRDYLERALPDRQFARTDGVGYVQDIAAEAQNCDVVSGHLTAYDMSRIERPAFKMIVLREPVERLLSHYYFHKSYTADHIRTYGRDLLVKTKEKPLGELLDDDEYRDFYSAFYAKRLDPEYAGSGEPMLERAMSNLGSFDVIGITSRMPEFLDSVSAALGTEPASHDVALNARRDRVHQEGFEFADREPLSDTDLIKIEALIGPDRHLYNFAVSRAV